jgi:hypothetical protein
MTETNQVLNNYTRMIFFSKFVWKVENVFVFQLTVFADVELPQKSIHDHRYLREADC